jgi:uncharacterized protein
MELFSQGCTIPFIARYRKEATHSLDEVDLTNIRDLWHSLEDLDKRRKAIVESLEKRDLLTKELEKKLRDAPSLTTLEDLYLPYRPKRKTRASVAREQGLEPLAQVLFAQKGIDPDAKAREFLNPEKGVHTIDDALDGAGDIMAEYISENLEARQELRKLYVSQGVLRSLRSPKKSEKEASHYADYLDYKESLRSLPSHRILALFRGESEGMLSLSIQVPEDRAISILKHLFLSGTGFDAEEVRDALEDAWKRLLKSSLETEARKALKNRADAEAIRVFAVNLRNILMASPLGEKAVLALDPGFRTGCKVACLTPQGELLEHAVIFPHTSQKKQEEAREILTELIRKYSLQAIAVGNGTAGRETLAFLRTLKLSSTLPVISVNESGASIYSTSERARKEFPDFDATVRSAVSIGRRLMDPLAELVKIDPKSIGVGQYQHDVDQKMLRQALQDTVEQCVNAVGVMLNTASPDLLTYVSGLGPQLAAGIVSYREEHGPFRSRQELLKVPRLGEKAFQQCAGFLRIRSGTNPLDASAVHPENYPLVERMAEDAGRSVEELMQSPEIQKKIDLSRYVTPEAGMPTLEDIREELARPGRDPREILEPLLFDETIQTMEDLLPGMVLPGIVTNVTAFGAFVDIGVHQDGLVHISKMGNRFIASPTEVVRVGEQVSVAVLGVELERKRISLSMHPEDFPKAAPPRDTGKENGV